MKARVLSLGAGVQSSTLALLYDKELIPNPPDFAIFADTEREPGEVYKYLKFLQDTITLFPIYVASKADLGFSPHKVPFFIKNPDGSVGMGWRQCTVDYKIRVVDKKLREVLGYKPRIRMKHEIEMLIGISTDEVQRMKDAREKWKTNEYPLVDIKWSRQDCLDWYKSEKYPAPPRSACYFCPYKSDREWHRMKTEMPDEWGKACAYDNWIRSDEAKASHNIRNDQYLHRTLMPLELVSFLSVEEELSQLDFGFDNECEGMCGL